MVTLPEQQEYHKIIPLIILSYENLDSEIMLDISFYKSHGIQIGQAMEPIQLTIAMYIWPPAESFGRKIMH